MLQGEPVGNNTSLAEQGALTVTPERKKKKKKKEKKKVYHLWKKGQATQEEYKDFTMLCRQQIT